eukprot:Awhi_evm2s13785
MYSLILSSVVALATGASIQHSKINGDVMTQNGDNNEMNVDNGDDIFIYGDVYYGDVHNGDNNVDNVDQDCRETEHIKCKNHGNERHYVNNMHTVLVDHRVKVSKSSKAYGYDEHFGCVLYENEFWASVTISGNQWWTSNGGNEEFDTTTACLRNKKGCKTFKTMDSCIAAINNDELNGLNLGICDDDAMHNRNHFCYRFAFEIEKKL